MEVKLLSGIVYRLQKNATGATAIMEYNGDRNLMASIEVGYWAKKGNAVLVKLKVQVDVVSSD